MVSCDNPKALIEALEKIVGKDKMKAYEAVMNKK